MDKKSIESILKKKAKLRAELDGLSKETSFKNELEYFFPKLMDFYEKNGHFRVLSSHDPDLCDFNRRLYHKFNSWLYHKNQSELKPQHKYEDIEEQYFKTLNDNDYLPKFIRNRNMPSIWLSNYKILETFKKREGHCLVKTVNDASRSAELNKLGQWVALQRAKRKDNSLKAIQIKRLNDLNFVWITDLGEIFEGCKNGDQRALDTRNNLINSLDSSRDVHTASKGQDEEILMLNELAKYQETMHRLKIERERLKHDLRSLRHEIDRAQAIIDENKFKTEEQKEQTQQRIATLVSRLRYLEKKLLSNVESFEKLQTQHDEQFKQIIQIQIEKDRKVINK